MMSLPLRRRITAAKSMCHFMPSANGQLMQNLTSAADQSTTQRAVTYTPKSHLGGLQQIAPTKKAHAANMARMISCFT